MSHIVVPADESHYPALHRALDLVAREKRFLAVTEAPPYEQSAAFYRALALAGLPHFVALQDGHVVGWVDVSPVFGQSRAHIGVLGIALLPEARRKGTGAVLLGTAIVRSWEWGLTRLELTVRVDNVNAKALYERSGFEYEGTLRRASLIDGEYHDMHAMALLRE